MALAPIIPEAGLSVGLILLAIACLFLIALNKAWGFTLGALLRSLASAISILPNIKVLGHSVTPWGSLADAVRGIDNFVLHSIGVGITETQKGLHAVLGAMSWLLQETADQLAGLAEDTARALHFVTATAIPTALKVSVGPLVSRLEALAKRVEQLAMHPATIVHATTRVIAPGLHALEAKVDALAKQVSAAGAAAIAAPVTVPQTIIRNIPAVIPSDITRGIDGLWKRVRGIGRTLTPAGLAALVAAAVGMLGMTWTRCSNSRKYGQNVCGMNPDLLETLIADTLLVLGTVSLIEFAEGMQGIVGEVADPVATFWRA